MKPAPRFPNGRLTEYWRERALAAEAFIESLPIVLNGSERSRELYSEWEKLRKHAAS